MAITNIGENIRNAFTKDRLTVGLAFLNFILLILLIVGLFVTFRKTDSYSQKYIKELEAMEKERAAISRERAAWREVNAQKDEIIRDGLVRDSIFRTELSRNYILLTEIDKNHEKVINSIRNSTPSQLKRAYAEFK